MKDTRKLSKTEKRDVIDARRASEIWARSLDDVRGHPLRPLKMFAPSPTAPRVWRWNEQTGRLEVKP